MAMRSADVRNRNKRKLVARVGELSHGQSKKFTLRRGGRDFEAMLLNYGGNLYAYVNRCPHVGISLDWVDNQFFTVDNRYLMCANHGAVFEPPTGECVWGPCVGAALESVALDIQGEKVFAFCPAANEERDSSRGSGK
jgi:nitrite reductase/ring-hydroxylating ferredoxin subunit